jgi:tRNA G10  N-methylase Trm11
VEEQLAQLEMFDAPDVHSTFRGGKVAPLHRWFPFPEGYSPRFVEQILERFAPRARRILDPFSGTGTTPLTVARLGGEAFYAEINPFLQHLTQAKISALLLSAREREHAAAALHELSGSAADRLRASSPDRLLAAVYKKCFGSSQFFRPSAFELVLRARSLLDELARERPAVAEFATVAALASLIPASSLKRAGDLRFRRGHELGREASFAKLFALQLAIVAEDLAEAEPIESAPVLLAGNARAMQAGPSLAVEAVVTSPPYLNGTNYFRNTKVELWFLRALEDQETLARFRFNSVTAGINDVVRRKPVSDNPDVQAVVKRLNERAYDQRIGQMVGSYFYDMEQVLRGIVHHLVPGATVAIDIGDSIYAKTHVRTDQLLTAVAKPLGLVLQDALLLRQRVSYNGTRLKQVLLVFRYQSPRARHAQRPAATPWVKTWRVFKDTLPHHRQPYAKRNWGHPLHSLCSYQGKMKPSLAHLVRSFVPPGGRVLDPFAGVGTIPFEAALDGATAFGFEISPAALPIAGAKLARHSRAAACLVVQELEAFMRRNEPTAAERESAKSIDFNSSIVDYFHERTLEEILLARRFFAERFPHSAEEKLVLACLLHILHGNRPYALSRRSHPITPFAPTGPRAYRGLIERLRDKLERSLETQLPDGFQEGRVFECDATGHWPDEVEDLDAVITSPPFFDSTRFHTANWMRLWFAGWERADFQSKPKAFVDERQKASLRVYEAIFRQSRERLRSGGLVLLHLGQSHKCDMATGLQEVAAPWFRVADRFEESVEHCESHGIRDKGTVTAHQYLVLH